MAIDKNDEIAIAVVGVVIVGLLLFFVIHGRSVAAKKKVVNPGASTSTAGLTNAACSMIGAAAGVPIPPGLCAALAPYANDLTQAGGKYAVANVKDVLSVGRTTVSTATGYASTAISTAGKVAAVPLKVVGGVVDVGEKVGSSIGNGVKKAFSWL